jgi:putative pyruvate formate lyase activating enzyme
LEGFEETDMAFAPSYVDLFERGELGRRIRLLQEFLKECRLCPRECRVNRLDGEVGYCGAGSELTVSSAFPHFGEERPLVGDHGSGTIFLTYCNLRCIFCQNYDISHLGGGERITTLEMARAMVKLQEIGCHNINFVTPTHYAPQIVASLPKAIEMGLRLPIVYNCSGYESIEVIRLLDGIVDIYMPDIKYMDEKYSKRFSNAPDYPEVVKKVLKEMHRQVGDLTTNSEGIAERGLLIRHLVMPEEVASSEAVLKFISEEISVHSYVNIMAQYRPEYRASEYPEISRRITHKEFLEAIQLAKGFRLYRGF